ncbi:extracellular solute-binding protein [Paenibacillus sp. YN15]|uniref:extracellular solute-binding protein n=1 Tax=Paenibacillus sp. YN15 TaxID=1742774 RepID=UPI0015EC4D39|nr:extracellular solute-binding protein [Paenibacillus sp. YN15]
MNAAGWARRTGLIAMLILFVLEATACFPGRDSSALPPSSPPAAAATGSNAAAHGTPLRMFVSNNAQQIPAGKAMNLPTVQYLARQTGTELDITFLPHENYMEQLRLKFASGDIPDVHMVWGAENSELVASNLALDLRPYIDAYGPNLRKFIPQSAWDAVTMNGKIVAIPQIAQGNAPAERLLFVRKDWMDKLGLEEPQTSGEFLDMLRAFRDGDPNGNGLPDEIPFSSREKLEWADNIFGMFGINPDSNVLYQGEIIPGFVHPNMKEALGFMRTMYQEGLLDKEFLTNSRAMWDQKIKSDLVGVWNHVVFGVYDPWQKELSSLIPEKRPNVEAISTPRGAGYEGSLGRVEKPVLKTFIVYKETKHPEAAVRMMDWLISEEGQLFAELGVEGISYTRKNGAIQYNAKNDRDLRWRSAVFMLHGFRDQAQKALINNEESYRKLLRSIEISRKEGIPNPTSGMPPSDTMTKKPDLTYKGTFQEAATSIILGEKPLDTFDDFVAEWKTQGGEDIIREMTGWYKANRANK